MKLVVGLGNPEKQYEHTRHNVGFRILDTLVQDWKFDKKSNSQIHQDTNVLYVKPQTFMNRSGESIQKLFEYYKINDPKNVLVIWDDKDLPFSTIRFREYGSSGGHRGALSTIEAIGEDFPRLKIGIAPTTPDTIIHDTADYVLAEFSKAEEKQLPEIIERAVAKVKEWVTPTHPNV